MTGSFGTAVLGIFLTGLCLAPIGRLQAAGPAPRPACPCTLAWNASLDPRVAGYAVYYSRVGSSVTNRVDAGTATSVTLYNLLASSNYVFYAVSYSPAGVESVPSNILPYRPSALSRLQLANLADGTIRLGFQAGTGALCRIEYTASLFQPVWKTLGNVTASSNGQVVWNEPPTNRPPMRFYRVVLP